MPFFAPGVQVVFRSSPKHSVEQKRTQRSHCFVTLCILNISLSISVETVVCWSAYDLFKMLMYGASTSNLAKAFHGASCCIVSKAFAKSTVAIHILTRQTRHFFVQATCMSLDGPVFAVSGGTLPSQEVVFCEACCKACCTEVYNVGSVTYWTVIVCSLNVALFEYLCYSHSLPYIWGDIFAHYHVVEDFSNHILSPQRIL